MGNKNNELSYEDVVRRQYHEADRIEKKKVLDEYCQTLGYHRKSAIRRLNSPLVNGLAKKRGRKAYYDYEELKEVLRGVWSWTDYMCSKNLKKAIPKWLPYVEQEEGNLSEKVRKDILRISPATIDRLLKPLKGKFGRGYGLTKPGTLLRNQIPIRTDFWDATQPGYIEADTVAHCGNSIAGNFVYSLTMTDIYSGWTECRATWNKGAEGIKNQVADIENTLPFDILGFDSDNGSEFLNGHLLSYFFDRKKIIPFTRSRAYRKNDNAHVEQKNWMHPRQLLGYARLDNPELVALINDTYKNYWCPLRNHFFPMRKLSQKVKIQSKYRRVYDDPTTPFQRLLNSKDISEQAKQKLSANHATLNPIKLQKALRHKLQQIRHISMVTPILSHRSGSR